VAVEQLCRDRRRGRAAVARQLERLGELLRCSLAEIPARLATLLA
jgi:hypothetical protein